MRFAMRRRSGSCYTANKADANGCLPDALHAASLAMVARKVIVIFIVIDVLGIYSMYLLTMVMVVRSVDPGPPEVPPRSACISRF